MLNIGRGHRHLLLNRADDAVGIDADKVEAILGMTVAAQISTLASTSRPPPTPARPIIVGDPDHPSSAAIRKLAATLAGELVGATRPARPADAAERRRCAKTSFRIRR